MSYQSDQVFSNYDKYFGSGKWVSNICMVVCCTGMMLIMLVAIKCVRVIARSSSVSLRMLDAKDSSDTDFADSDEKQRDSAHLKTLQIHINTFFCFSSSSLPFYFFIPHFPRPLTLIEASFFCDWEIYNPISTAPCPWVGLWQAHKCAKPYKNSYKHILVQTEVCTLAHQADVWALF